MGYSDTFVDMAHMACDNVTPMYAKSHLSVCDILPDYPSVGLQHGIYQSDVCDILP